MKDNNSTFKVKANEFEFSFSMEEINAIDYIQKSPVDFNLLKNNRSVNAKLLATDSTSKKQTIEVEGEKFEIEIKEELDQMLEKMGFGLVANKQIKHIKAPMPGLVLEIHVSNGQSVNEGDKLLILSAMKMENSIMIHANAVIKRVLVAAGDAVDKGQVLVELE